MTPSYFWCLWLFFPGPLQTALEVTTASKNGRNTLQTIYAPHPRRPRNWRPQSNGSLFSRIQLRHAQEKARAASFAAAPVEPLSLC
jgi:hypothetical protein